MEIGYCVQNERLLMRTFMTYVVIYRPSSNTVFCMLLISCTAVLVRAVLVNVRKICITHKTIQRSKLVHSSSLDACVVPVLEWLYSVQLG